MIRRFSKALLTIAALSSILNAQSLPPLTHHVRDVVVNGQAKPVGQLPLNQTMNLDVVLPLRDQAGLDSFLAELYDPASLIYRHFLSVSEFTDRFGPSQQDYDAVVHFAQAHGFAVVGGTRDGMDVQIKARPAQRDFSHPVPAECSSRVHQTQTSERPKPLKRKVIQENDSGCMHGHWYVT